MLTRSKVLLKQYLSALGLDQLKKLEVKNKVVFELRPKQNAKICISPNSASFAPFLIARLDSNFLVVREVTPPRPRIAGATRNVPFDKPSASFQRVDSW